MHNDQAQQPGQVGQSLPIPGGRIGINNPLDLHGMALEVKGEIGKKLQPPGLQGLTPGCSSHSTVQAEMS